MKHGKQNPMVRYMTEVSHSDPVGDDMPACAFMSIDLITATRIVEWADYVIEHGLQRIEKADDRVLFYTEDYELDEKRGDSANDYLEVKDAALVVNGDEFWFEARSNKFEAELSTDGLSVDELAEKFGLQRTRVSLLDQGRSPSP